MKEIEEIKIHGNSVAAKALREGRWEEYEAWMTEVEKDAQGWNGSDLAERGRGVVSVEDSSTGVSVRRVRRPLKPTAGMPAMNTWRENHDSRAGDAADLWLKEAERKLKKQ